LVLIKRYFHLFPE